MKSFHNDQKIKDKYLNRVREHRLAERLIRGQGWAPESQKGCAVGCTLNGYNHKAYETELGIPAWLAYVEDRLYEGMTLKKSKTWPEKFLKAIPLGVDLEPVKREFLIFVLNRALEKFDHKKSPKCTDAVKLVIATWENLNSTKADFRSAAAYAADAAYAYAADAYAADAAAYAAAAAAAAAYAAAAAAAAYADAADAAAYAAAADAAADARKKEHGVFADKLFEILRETK